MKPLFTYLMARGKKSPNEISPPKFVCWVWNLPRKFSGKSPRRTNQPGRLERNIREGTDSHLFGQSIPSDVNCFHQWEGTKMKVTWRRMTSYRPRNAWRVFCRFFCPQSVSGFGSVNNCSRLSLSLFNGKYIKCPEWEDVPKKSVPFLTNEYPSYAIIFCKCRKSWSIGSNCDSK